MPAKIFTFLLLWLALFFPSETNATHLRGGEITLKRTRCDIFQYEVTLTLYTNTNSATTPGRGNLVFGDGAFVTLPTLTNTLIDPSFGIGAAVYKVTHTFNFPGDYLLSYAEGNRNAGILNIQNSVNVPFYVETRVKVDPNIPCNHPIGFSILPIDKACRGIVFSHNPGAFDVDGDSLSYGILVPKRSTNIEVAGFLFPNNVAFYTGINYQQGNEAQNGPPLFQIDPVTGTLIWDAPRMVGQYEITFKVTEWKKISGTYVNVGFVIRDMQIIVEDCMDTRPFLVMPPDICVSPGDVISKKIKAIDADRDKVIIEVFTTDDFFSSPPQLINQNVYQSTRPPYDTANLQFKWNITCDLVRDQPYTIIFKVTDLTQQGFKLSTFHTWTISVIGAKPKFSDMVLNVATKGLRLEWNPYVCQDADSIEVWRRAGEVQFAIDNCKRGIPRSLGFEKIGVAVHSNFFLDKDLSPGAEYCYRLVARFYSPHKSLSIVSKDTCVGPIVIDAPVITNVSVVTTDRHLGKVMVRWTSPFQINKTDFPPPYEYEVFRIDTSNTFVKIPGPRIIDTTFVDTNLHTSNIVYGYKIVVYAPTGLSRENPVDTSVVAYLPRLESAPKPGAIYLSWNAKVPWTNQSTQFPWHRIYRMEAGSNFVLIDSIDGNGLLIDQGFEYLDEGKFKGKKLDENTVYHYKVSTTGVYGNPKIKEPLINFSQEVSVQPIDRSPPCKPLIVLAGLSCEDFKKTSVCNFNDFSNTLTWTYPENCGNDVSFYQVLFAAGKDQEFTLLATETQNGFTHKKPDSFLGCYKLRAIDLAGNIGAESDTVCSENCPYIFIPNVFTPANKDGLNDFFPGITKLDLEKTDPDKCPRFVKALEIKIYDRLGIEVYAINNLVQQTSLEWTGLDVNGKELPAGIYFYSANIRFDAADPSQQIQNVKGWVSLIR